REAAQAHIRYFDARDFIFCKRNAGYIQHFSRSLPMVKDLRGIHIGISPYTLTPAQIPTGSSITSAALPHVGARATGWGGSSTVLGELDRHFLPGASEHSDGLYAVN